jgi:hypothetical protein
MNTRHKVLAAALAATLVAVWWSGRDLDDVDAEIVAAAPRKAANSASVASRIAPQAAPMASNSAADSPATDPEPRFVAAGPDLFPGLSWRPPPPAPPVVVEAPPPPPQAPPLPFKYVGRWAADDGETLFLAQGERVLTAKPGELLGQWRLDAADAGGLTFTYLPLQQKRQLRYGP